MSALKIKRVLLLLLVLFIFLPAQAGEIDLGKEPVYVRKGFDPAYINSIPGAEEKNIFICPGGDTCGRKIVLKDLPLEGMPQRRMFSLKKYPPENFTFTAQFMLNEIEGPPGILRGVYFANIGENWAVYLNGHLLRSEIHLDDRGRITDYRHYRKVIVPIDPRCFVQGKNILTVRIVGDPTNIDSGFHRSTPFIIDSLENLNRLRTEQTELILIFIYLFFGIYHLFLFLKRPVEKYNFYYSAFSVMLFVYLISRTSTVYSVIPDSTILHRIEYCSLYALIPLFGAFADTLLSGKVGRVTGFYGVFYALLAAVTVMPVSNPFAIDVLRVWQVTSLFAFLYILFYRIGRPVVLYFKTLYSDYRSLPVFRRIGVSVYRSLFIFNTGQHACRGAYNFRMRSI
jgi:hypothetical protein